MRKKQALTTTVAAEVNDEKPVMDCSQRVGRKAGKTEGQGSRGSKRRPNSICEAEVEAMAVELRNWATEYWVAVYKVLHPDWSADILRSRAEEKAARDPITLGFFLPREERDGLLAQGLDHFQIETHTFLRCIQAPRRRGG